MPKSGLPDRPSLEYLRKLAKDTDRIDDLYSELKRREPVAYNGTVLHGQTPGFLGAAHASFDVDQDLLAENVRIQAVERAVGLTELRMSGRREWRTIVCTAVVRPSTSSG